MTPAPTVLLKQARFWAAVAAATLPSLLAFSLPPYAVGLNQSIALALWGAFAALSIPARAGRSIWPLLAALGLVALAATGSWGLGGLPSSMALSALGMLAAAALLVAGGAAAARRVDAEVLFAAFCWAWLIAGFFNVGVALIQVFAPAMADGDWIAASRLAGRAVGNMRQPNHLSSLLLWACIATVALVEMRRLSIRWGATMVVALIFALVLSASRTGLLSVALLALWGLGDRRLTRPTRALLLLTPLFYAAAWFGMAQWAAASGHSFGGQQRLAETDISSSRFAIWANALELIRSHPWLGVGFGNFNFAWTLTPFPDRPVAFFDNTHNLPLQLAVELGLPLAALVIALLVWALWRGARQAWRLDDGAGIARRAAMLMLLMIGLHSLLEFPLWYAYFLLPAAWAWGFALQSIAEPDAARPPSWRKAPLAWAGLAMVAVGAFVAVDYTRVAMIFTDRFSNAPDVERIARGQDSVLFSHFTAYAAVTSGLVVPTPMHEFARAAYPVIDARLMVAWSQALAQHGDLDGARYIAARLREFRNPEAKAFFAPCPVSAAAAAPGLPFQCERPTRALAWQDFRSRHD